MSIGGAFRLYSDYWHGYLAFTPCDGSMTWPGADAREHAHVFSYTDACSILLDLPSPWLVRLVDAVDRTPMPIPVNAQLPAKKKGVAA